MDYKTNNGYILGTPFIHAFNIILDFDQNRLGFANKVKGFGSEITGKGAPGPVRDDTKPDDKEDPVPDDKEDPDKDDPVPDDKDDPVPDDKEDPDTEKPDDHPEIIIDPNDGTEEHLPTPIPKDDSPPPKANLTALFAFVAVVFIGGLCIIISCCKGRKNKSMFAKTTEVRKERGLLQQNKAYDIQQSLEENSIMEPLDTTFEEVNGIITDEEDFDDAVQNGGLGNNK